MKLKIPATTIDVSLDGVAAKLSLPETIVDIALVETPPPPPPPPPDDHDHDHTSSMIKVTDTEILFHGERVPRFASNPTSVAVKSGNWSDETVFDITPRPGARVVVPHGITVVYDKKSTDKLDCIEVEGCLDFSNTTDTELWVDTITVLPAGCLCIRPGDKRVEIVFPDGPLRDTDINQNGKGLLVFGEIDIHGAPVVSYAALAEDIFPGNISFRTKSIAGWSSGSKLVFPGTAHKNPQSSNYYKFQPTYEEATVAEVEGLNIELEKPLMFPHYAPLDMQGRPCIGHDGQIITPHVARLDRSVTIRSERSEGTRGHVQLFGDAKVRIKYAHFADLGRTTVGPLDPITNRVGRYAIHCHHLVGRPGGVDGWQYVIEGNSVTGGKKWGLTIHGSHYGLVRNNVVYNVDGACIATEDGSETGNLIEYNFVCRANGSLPEIPGDLKDRGDRGDGFWFVGPFNIIRHNIATNCFRSCYEGTAEGLPAVDNHYNRPVKTPVTPLGELVTRNVFREPLKNFEYNIGYGESEIGVRLWSFGDRRVFPSADPADVNILRNGTFWHIVGGSFVAYYIDNQIVENWIHIGDKGMIHAPAEAGPASNAWIGEAAFNGGSVSRRTKLINANLQGCNYGYFHRAHSFTEYTEIVNCTFDCAVGILVHNWAENPATGVSETYYVDLLFKDSYSPGSLRAMIFSWDSGVSEKIAQTPETHTVINYQRVEGLHLNVYYKEQGKGLLLRPANLPPGATPKGKWAPTELDNDKGQTALIRGRALGIEGLVFIADKPAQSRVFANVLLEEGKHVMYYVVIGDLANPTVTIDIAGSAIKVKGKSGKVDLSQVPSGMKLLSVTCEGAIPYSSMVKFPVKL